MTSKSDPVIAAHPTLADLPIAALTTLGPGAEPLRAEAETPRIDFVRRLFEDHATGVNRFDRPGERLLGAWHGGRFVAVGGLNCDPYAADDGIGRLRHLYVRASHWRLGIGALPVRALLREAEGRFRVVRLRTAAAAFYRRLGFVGAAEPNATHLIRLIATP